MKMHKTSKNPSQLVCQAHLQVIKTKHYYPVITRHKEVTAISGKCLIWRVDVHKQGLNIFL